MGPEKGPTQQAPYWLMRETIMKGSGEYTTRADIGVLKGGA
jgi:hypothetical protein